MNVHSVSYTHILTERCWDSKKHYVDFFTGYNNCSYKNIKINVKVVNMDPNQEVRYIKPCLTCKIHLPAQAGPLYLGLESNLEI